MSKASFMETMIQSWKHLDICTIILTLNNLFLSAKKLLGELFWFFKLSRKCEWSLSYKANFKIISVL